MRWIIFAPLLNQISAPIDGVPNLAAHATRRSISSYRYYDIFREVHRSGKSINMPRIGYFLKMIMRRTKTLQFFFKCHMKYSRWQVRQTGILP